MGKKGQMKLSFGMIFSIILIIVFVAFAFFGIKKFLDIQDSAKIGKFVDELQNDVNKIWKGSLGSQQEEYILPSKVEKVCFVDYSTSSIGKNAELYSKLKQVFYEFENMIFYPVGSGAGLDAKNIKNIDISTTTGSENPLCINNVKGKVKLTIKMSHGESLVTITR